MIQVHKNTKIFNRSAKFLIGYDVFESWIPSLERMTCNTLIMKPFEDLNALDVANVDYVLPMSHNDYMKVKDKFPDKILWPIKSYDILNNKCLFGVYMQANYPNYIPDIYYLNDDDVEIIKVPMCWPAIHKMRFGECGNGITIINSYEEFSQLIYTNCIVQQFIQDNVEYAAFLFCIDAKVINYKVICNSFDNFNIKKGKFETFEFVDIDISIIIEILEKLEYCGGCCVNFKISNSVIKIFEINPRFGGTCIEYPNQFLLELLDVKIE